MDDQARIPAPNYTQIPNVILDLMSDMEETEFRVVIAIARQTFGWHKKRDKISLTQLEKLTGLSRQGVVNGIAAGERRGLIEKTKDESDNRGGIWYRLLVDQSNELTSQLNGLVKDVNQSTELTRTSQLNGLELVNSVDTQKKGKEKKESGGDTPTRPLSELAIAIADVCRINPQIATDKQKRTLNATYQALKSIGATPAEVRARESWWYANDWRAKKEGRAPRPDELQAIWEEAAAPVKKQPAERVAPTSRLSGAKSPAPADAQPPQQTAAGMRALLERTRENNAH